jgi:hypothetical protein
VEGIRNCDKESTKPVSKVWVACKDKLRTHVTRPVIIKDPWVLVLEVFPALPRIASAIDRPRKSVLIVEIKDLFGAHF